MAKLRFLTLLVALDPFAVLDIANGRDYQQEAEKAPWIWSDSRARLTYCVDKHLEDYEVEVIRPKAKAFRHDKPLTVRLMKDGVQVYAFKANWSTVFTRNGDILFVADFHPLSPGCQVLAVDFKTGKQVWQCRLKGLGPISNSEYHNDVSIEFDGQVVVVRGKESAGRYIEFVDKSTGKTVGNRVYKKDD